jgi:hypothetical protein
MPARSEQLSPLQQRYDSDISWLVKDFRMEILPRLADRGLEFIEPENAAGVIAAEEFFSGPGLKGVNGHKFHTSYAEASAGEDIAELVRGIENLTKDDAIARLLELEEGHEKTFFEIGGVLSAIQKRKWFEPFASLDEWVENNTALSRSKARALSQIYDSVVASGVKWADVKHLEWTKLNAIAGLLNAGNADHWIEVASNHNRAEIKQLVQEHVARSAGRKPKSATAARVKTFKFSDDQIIRVQAGIDRAKKMAGAEDDSAALEIVCGAYADQQVSVELYWVEERLLTFISGIDAGEGIKFRDAFHAFNAKFDLIESTGRAGLAELIPLPVSFPAPPAG